MQVQAQALLLKQSHLRKQREAEMLLLREKNVRERMEKLTRDLEYKRKVASVNNGGQQARGVELLLVVKEKEKEKKKVNHPGPGPGPVMVVSDGNGSGMNVSSPLNTTTTMGTGMSMSRPAASFQHTQAQAVQKAPIVSPAPAPAPAYNNTHVMNNIPNTKPNVNVMNSSGSGSGNGMYNQTMPLGHIHSSAVSIRPMNNINLNPNYYSTQGQGQMQGQMQPNMQYNPHQFHQARYHAAALPYPANQYHYQYQHGATYPLTTTPSWQPPLFNNPQYHPSSMNSSSSASVQLPIAVTTSRPLPFSTPTPIQRQRQPRQPKTILPQEMILHKEPLKPPSPFAKTHSLLSYKIVIYKRRGESFGVNLRYEKKGALVEIEFEKEEAKVQVQAKVDVAVDVDVAKVETGVSSRGVSTCDNDINKVEMKAEAENVLESSTDGEQKQAPMVNQVESEIHCGELLQVEAKTALTLVGAQDTAAKESSPAIAIATVPSPHPPNSMQMEVEEKMTSMGTSGENSMLKPDDPTNNSMASTIPLPSPSGTTAVASKPKKKRIQFGVMTVTSATTQNNRAKAGMAKDHMLQSGDIVLEIDGNSISDMLFNEATKLFGKCKEKQLEMDNGNGNVPASAGIDANANIVVECILTVARERRVTKILDKLTALSNPPLISKSSMAGTKQIFSHATPSKINSANEATHTTSLVPVAPIAPVKIPFIANETNVVAGEFAANELKALIAGVGEARWHVDESTFVKILANPVHRSQLMQRTENDLIGKWVFETRAIDKTLLENATTHWKKAWQAEVKDANDDETTISYLSPSQRSNMRSAPRPSRGCKCGRLDHVYVHDAKCILYRDLKSLANSYGGLEESDATNSSLNNLNKYDGKLNSIGNAHVQRLMKQQEQTKAEQTEAKFVDEMERIQASKLQLAVFAPRLLSVMILSSIASFADNDEVHPIEGNAIDIDDDDGSDSDDSDSDDGEDVPLMALGRKRPSTGSQQTLDKKQRIQKPMPNSYCMAQLLHHISKTWGHLYWEPTQSETAW